MNLELAQQATAAVGAFAETIRLQGSTNMPDYSTLKEPNNIGPGLETTSAQRKRILEANRNANNGVLKSDASGKILDVPIQSRKGVPANMNQAEVDHIIPRSKGGTNSNSNLRVISKEENLKKGNKTN